MKSHLNRIHDWPRIAHDARYHAGRLAVQTQHSLRQLERYFLNTFGQPPQAWLDQQRLVKCLDLLQDGKHLKEIAAELGYSHSSHLIRHFKREFGTTPMQFLQSKVLPGKPAFIRRSRRLAPS
ncbi:MAG: helix-turn-helix transcriptional regulator [Verrucomicrobiota bacterium]